MDRYGIDGRKPTERRDCVVRAFCIATGMPYEVAWLAMSIQGRRAKCGTYKRDWLPAFQHQGLCLDADKLDRLDYQLMVATNTLDNVIIEIKGHLFAIRNGQHSDGVGMTYPASKIVSIWRIK